LRDTGKLYPYEESHLDELRQWFNTHLEKPTRLTAAKPPYYRKKNRAISWFKDSAQEHIARIREIVAMLENHGIPVRTIKTKRVGYVVYEDEHLVVAEPFPDL
jgi:protoheme ferro-lyase